MPPKAGKRSRVTDVSYVTHKPAAIVHPYMASVELARDLARLHYGCGNDRRHRWLVAPRRWSAVAGIDVLRGVVT